MSSPKVRYTGLPLAGIIVAALVVVKSIANIPVFIGAGLGHLWATVLSGSPVWIIGGHLAAAAAMFIFGIVLRGRLTALEPEAIRRLLRAYGLCSMIFAPHWTD